MRLVNHASLLCITDEAMKRYIKPHHVHIGSLLAYFFLNYAVNGDSIFFSYPAALAMVASGKVDLTPLVTHHFNLDQSQQAFQTAVSRDSRAIKVMIHCD